ncbi:MAG: hypothetical protein V7707_06345, partial [Motiliproteus sp.]
RSGSIESVNATTTLKNAATITLNAFCSEDILRAIAGMAFGYPGFVSAFRLEVDRHDIDMPTERFIGMQEWDASEIAFDQIVAKFFDNDPFQYFLANHFGEHRTLNHDIMSDLGLTNEVFRDAATELEKVRIQGATVVTSSQAINGSIANLIDRNVDEVHKIVDLFMSHDQGFKRIITDWVNRTDSA